MAVSVTKINASAKTYLSNKFLFLGQSALLLCLLLLFSASANSKTYTIARAPQLSIHKTEKAWGPYLQYLNKNTSYKFELKLYNSRELFENDVKNAKIDFYFGNPGYAIVGHLNDGYLPIIRSNKKKLTGIIVVKKDSAINKIEDINKKTLVFPGKTAFAASLLIKHYLSKDYDISFNEAYVIGHDNVYRNVLNGTYDAGGGVYKTLNREPEGIKKRLKIIYETPGVSSHPLVVHPSVPADVGEAVIRKTLALQKSSSGKKILKKVKLSHPVKTDYDKEYKPLETLVKKVYSYLLK